MILTSRRVIKNLLKKYGGYPLKRLGQNFLVDSEVLKKIIKAANLQPDDIVLEIGPGIGVLTQELAKKAERVIAIEKDSKMVEILKETLKDLKNVKIIQGDILKTTHYPLPTTHYKIVANLPFYITSPVIRMFLESLNSPKEMTLTIQKEVAQRICSKPPKMSLLAVSVQFYADAKIISYIPKKSFWPQPEVDAAILQIVPRSLAYGSVLFREQFFRIVKTGFSHPRKQLANNLSNGLALSPPNGLKLNKKELSSLLVKNNIQPSQRAETLNIEDWLKLTEAFKTIY